MEELYINNILVDFKFNGVSLTSQINDIAELADRQVGYSNSIKLPLTSRNKKALNLLGIAGNTSRTPYSKLNVKYVYNGIELVSNGYGVIKSTGKYFELVIYDGAKDIFSSIENKELQDLDFTAYNHNLDVDTFIASHSNTDGYIYPIANYSGSGDATFILETFSPCFYVHTLFEMIFEQAGYTISGNILDSAEFKSRVTTMQKGYTRSVNNNLFILLNDNLTGGATETYEYTDVPPQTVSFLKHTYTVLTEGNILIRGIGDIIPKIGDGSDYNILIDINGTVSSYTKNLFFNTTDIFDVKRYLYAGDVINIYIEATSIVTGLPNDHSKISFATDYTMYIFNSVENSVVNFENEIGDDSQKEFVKDVMQRFGMIIKRVKNTNEYKIITMKDLLSDRANAENWSDKYSEFIKESYKPNYAKRNYFKFKYDDEAEGSKTYADGYISLDNDVLANTKTIATSIFTATNEFQLTKTSVFDEAYFIQNWEYIPPFDGEPELYEFKPLETGIRIFKLQNKTRAVRIVSTWIGTNREFNIEMPYLDFDGVDYDFELSNSYVEIKNMLEDYRIVTAKINLSVLDNYKLDFFKLKYISHLGGYFYLNKVIEFKKGKATKVELIEV